MSLALNVGKKYGLTIPSRAKGKVVARASAFCDDDDDENCEENAGLTESKAVKKVGSETVLKRKTQLEIDKALAEDPTVYEYDAIYDKLQETKAANVPGVQKDKERKPKYIHTLLKTAEQRKKEYERRIERQVQKEREAEKGQFEDKETFVTSAYRKKMQEIAEEEEKEKRQAELEAKLDVTHQSDLSGFYRHLLRQTTGEEEVPDVTKVKTEPLDSETAAKQASSDIDFTEDRDATDSDNSTSSDRSENISTEGQKVSVRPKQEKDRRGSGSPEERQLESQLPDRQLHSSRTEKNGYRSRTPERKRNRSRTPDRKRYKSRTPERKRYRSRTPDRKRYRSRTPDRKRYRSRTPDRKRYRSRTPDKKRYRSKTPDRKRYRSKTPDKKRYRSRTPDRKRYRSKTPEKKRYRSRTPERKVNRSRTPERNRDRSRTPEKYHNNASSNLPKEQSSQKTSQNKNNRKFKKEAVENASLVSVKQEADTNEANSNSKSKSEVSQETKAQMWSVKFAKRNVGDTLEEARARYLARKEHRIVAVAVEQD